MLGSSTNDGAGWIEGSSNRIEWERRNPIIGLISIVLNALLYFLKLRPFNLGAIVTSKELVIYNS